MFEKAEKREEEKEVELSDLIRECQKLIDRKFYGSLTVKFKAGIISPILHVKKTYKIYTGEK